MLAGQRKGQVAVGHEGDAVAVRAVNGIDRLEPGGLILQILRQVGHRNRAHINDGAFGPGKIVVLYIMVLPLG